MQLSLILRLHACSARGLQVVIAVDDSRSMAENGCGAVALEAVTLIARALARLEVGELGALRFGGAAGEPPPTACQPIGDAPRQA